MEVKKKFIVFSLCLEKHLYDIIHFAVFIENKLFDQSETILKLSEINKYFTQGVAVFKFDKIYVKPNLKYAEFKSLAEQYNPALPHVIDIKLYEANSNEFQVFKEMFKYKLEPPPRPVLIRQDKALHYECDGDVCRVITEQEHEVLSIPPPLPITRSPTISGEQRKIPRYNPDIFPINNSES